MRHCLLTGGAGFIGSHLAARLLDCGFRITIADNFDPFYSRELKQENLEPLLARPNLRLVECDIADFSSLSAKLGDDYDVIVHLAAKAGVRPSIADPLAYQHANVSGTQALLEFARQFGIRQFVFASSSSVYGTNPHTPWREDDYVLQPISPYASTKVSGELLGHVYAHLYGIRFLALRLFTVYGPRQRPDLAIRKYAELMLANQPVPVFGDGTSGRDYTYVEDIVEGFRAAIDYDQSFYEVINVGNERPVKLLEMLETIEEALGVRAVRNFLPMQPGDVPFTCADIAKARRLLGYEPRTLFKDGIAKFATWIRSRNPSK